MLCMYKDVLGKPNQGFHSTRIMGFALYDIIGTLVLAWLYSLYMKTSYITAVVLMFIVATIIHWLFCVDTALLRTLSSTN